MAVLTETQILARTKADSLHQVRNLNLWGNDLTDVSVVRRMPQVEVLSLSVNKISSLRDFSQCDRLTELYLRKNEVHELAEVLHLCDLRHLRILWLCDNPCAQQSGYREFVIRHLPRLAKLDNLEITEEERQKAYRRWPEEMDARDLPPDTRPNRNQQQLHQHQPQPQHQQQNYYDDTSRQSNPYRHHADRPLSAQQQPQSRGLERFSSAPSFSQSPEQEGRLDAMMRMQGGNSYLYEENRNFNAGQQFNPTDIQGLNIGGGLRPDGVGATAFQSPAGVTSNVLYAVLALVNDLDDESLDIVRGEIGRVKTKRKQRMERNQSLKTSSG